MLLIFYNKIYKLNLHTFNAYSILHGTKYRYSIKLEYDWFKQDRSEFNVIIFLQENIFVHLLVLSHLKLYILVRFGNRTWDTNFLHHYTRFILTQALQLAIVMDHSIFSWDIRSRLIDHSGERRTRDDGSGSLLRKHRWSQHDYLMFGWQTHSGQSHKKSYM
jgi:hypothetical protein